MTPSLLIDSEQTRKGVSCAEAYKAVTESFVPTPTKMSFLKQGGKCSYSILQAAPRPASVVLCLIFLSEQGPVAAHRPSPRLGAPIWKRKGARHPRRTSLSQDARSWAGSAGRTLGTGSAGPALLA